MLFYHSSVAGQESVDKQQVQLLVGAALINITAAVLGLWAELNLLEGFGK